MTSESIEALSYPDQGMGHRLGMELDSGGLELTSVASQASCQAYSACLEAYQAYRAFHPSFLDASYPDASFLDASFQEAFPAFLASFQDAFLDDLEFLVILVVVRVAQVVLLGILVVAPAFVSSSSCGDTSDDSVEFAEETAVDLLETHEPPYSVITLRQRQRRLLSAEHAYEPYVACA
ncbi:hypothetical protein GCK72_013529 [Caenorhabditis remanei]|uniref:Uncharacterized protein n=1 Tax=Caenorhabditis remanei TaxID=31234 RepID=A0A6A5GR16_CAERE|nr:hypothetical protein GCK72_013529 [Caenorhabditis remanei]KAF1757074.1 hypothetical protein GCK72_013529 [Caenorhabditis remanei]